MPVAPPLPVGFRLRPDGRTHCSDDGRVLDGGVPWRLLRLSDRGAATAGRLLAGEPVTGHADGALARRLVETGVAHPLPPRTTGSDLSVVVPVRDRADDLDECLAALRPLEVVVVDDGSRDAVAIAAVARRHRARLLRAESSAGPAAARNLGAAETTTDLVAFVDSDCRADAATLRAVTDHFADPQVAVAAPRVRPQLGDAALALSGFAHERSPLDMGPEPATVMPAGRVAYLPTAAMIVRRTPFESVGGFDPALRYGEDVDLCWRLHDAGWAVRYDPRAVVLHREPTTWAGWLVRRFHYGTSAGPLARRHPDALRGPSLQGLVAPVVLARADARGSLPADVRRRVSLVAPAATAAGLTRWAAPLWCPAAALLMAPGRHGLPSVADGAAYGAGVWLGCVRARTLSPLLPRLSARRPAPSP